MKNKNQQQEILVLYPDTDMPGNGWKVTLPNGDFVFFEDKKKAKQFVEVYNKDLEKSPKKRKS